MRPVALSEKTLMGWDQAHTVAHLGAKHQALFVLPVFCERQYSDACSPVAHAPFSFKGVAKRIRKIYGGTGRLSVTIAIYKEFRFAFALRARAGMLWSSHKLQSQFMQLG